MSAFLKEGYKNLIPYVPGEQPKDAQYIKLNTNESPFPPSPEVLSVLKESEISDLRLYSDPESGILSKAAAEFFGISEKNILFTNGSDEALAFIFCGFFDKNRGVCFPDITYGFYPVFCQYAGLDINEIPLKDDFSIDLEAMKNRREHIVIANPNAPTGMTVSVADIKDLLLSDPTRLVIADEAYVDFGTYSCVPLIEEFGNLIVVQTFSKSRSLAGARLGMAIAREDIINDLKTVKYSFNPYNVNRLTERLGAAAIADRDYFDYCRATIMKNRAILTRDLKNLNFEVLPSYANFVFAKHDKVDGKTLYLELKKRNILVRWFDKERIRDYLRITVGTKEQLNALIKAIDEIVGGKK